MSRVSFRPMSGKHRWRSGFPCHAADTSSARTWKGICRVRSAGGSRHHPAWDLMAFGGTAFLKLDGSPALQMFTGCQSTGYLLMHLRHGHGEHQLGSAGIGIGVRYIGFGHCRTPRRDDQLCFPYHAFQRAFLHMKQLKRALRMPL